MAAAIGAFVIPIPIVVDVIATDILLINEGDHRDEDVYVIAESGRVDGTIDGDLIIVTGGLSIGGTVTGDVIVATHGEVTISGLVAGSVRGFARSVAISGTVGDDVAVVAASVDFSGTAGRDVLVLAGSLADTGSVGRDLRGRFVSGNLDGAVGRDVDVTVARITVGPDAVIGGDLLYRADSEARIDDGSNVAGQTARLSARGTFFVRVFLTAATVIGTLAFVLGGLILLWLFRSVAPRAVGAVLTSPWKALGVGLAAVVLVPMFAVFAAASLVGIPIAVALLLLVGLSLLFGPVPAVAAAGVKLVRGRYGLFAAFVVGAVVWRLGIWLLPIVGILLYFGGLILGVGGWLVGAWTQRRTAPVAGLPAAGVVAAE
jgi:cytoskeletal protein CcmA (bactofilin family)